MNSGINSTLQQVYNSLPLYSEEGSDSTEVNVNDLIEQIDAPEQAIAAVAIVQNLFTTLGLLDTQLLPQKLWRFVSFPASLMARSLLQSIADNDQTLFSNGFWSPQDSTSPVSDQQRNLLNLLESHRDINHKTNAKPIRYVHVAWGLIVVEGKVLLRHREDKSRPNQNNYVLIGGRLSQNDLRAAGEEDALKVLQSTTASENSKAIQIGLQREINEEAGLDSGNHYTFIPWRTIKPYRAVEGAGANHALTEYRINIFKIELTENGLFELLDNVKQDEHLIWFTLDELADTKTADGKMAYLDALVKDFETQDKWSQEAKGLTSSYIDKYAYHKETESVTLPIGKEDGIELGKTGKEKRLNITLTGTEKSLLIGLKLLGESESANADLKNIALIGLGWVKAIDQDICNELKALALKLAMADLPLIESRNESYFRLAIKPEYCFLNDRAYSFSVDVDDPGITLIRDEFDTPIGHFEQRRLIIDTSKNLAEEIDRVATNKDTYRRFDDENFSKLIRRDVRPSCNQLGLRTLVRTVSKLQVINAIYVGLSLQSID